MTGHFQLFKDGMHGDQCCNTHPLSMESCQFWNSDFTNNIFFKSFFSSVWTHLKQCLATRKHQMFVYVELFAVWWKLKTFSRIKHVIHLVCLKDILWQRHWNGFNYSSARESESQTFWIYHHICSYHSICEQQRRSSACASAQSDQCLCCSLPR